MTGFNVGCIDDIDIFKLKDVGLNDGQNHPLDKKWKQSFLIFLKQKKSI